MDLFSSVHLRLDGEAAYCGEQLPCLLCDAQRSTRMSILEPLYPRGMQGPAKVDTTARYWYIPGYTQPHLRLRLRLCLWLWQFIHSEAGTRDAVCNCGRRNTTR